MEYYLNIKCIRCNFNNIIKIKFESTCQVSKCESCEALLAFEWKIVVKTIIGNV